MVNILLILTIGGLVGNFLSPPASLRGGGSPPQACGGEKDL